IDPLRYPSGGVDLHELRELRRIKARVESERMPRGVPATHHLKLGRGGLTDVEWTAQLLQLQHAHERPELRVTGTLATLAAAEARSSGRTTAARVDRLPAERLALVRISRLLGYPAGHADDREEDWMRAARRARRVMEDIFYG